MFLPVAGLIQKALQAYQNQRIHDLTYHGHLFECINDIKKKK